MLSRRWMVFGSFLMLAAALAACGPKGGGGSVVSFTVNTADDEDDGGCTASHCSLREAIAAANSSPGFNKVFFNIPGAGVHIIETETGFPVMTDPIGIEGTTQPGYTDAPLIELRAGTAHFGTALSVHGGDSMIQGLAVVNFNIGIEIKDADNVWILGNYIGIRPDGVTAEGNQTAVAVWTGSNRIGGAQQLDFRNVISGNTAGVNVMCEADNNLIQNNYIGLDAAGTSAVANGTYGVHICGSNNTIGGEDALAGNVISGNAGDAVEILAETGHPATGNQIAKNLIGTDATGLSWMGNGGYGVLIVADGNTLAGNTISGNFLGGVIIDGHQGNLLTGNFIGVNSAGFLEINNIGDGVTLLNASNNFIGGGGAGAGNVISGNMHNGIAILADYGGTATANIVQGNKIGTNAGGVTEIANQVGIYISGSGNTIGGPSMDARNLISANYGDGIRISGNQNLVQNNYIGTDVSGENALGNQYNGVRLDNGASNNNIGTDTAGNLIAFNQGVGVWVADGAGSGNRIQFNSIHDNGGLGIALGKDSPPLPNDPGDADTGPNQLVNSPTMISAISQFNSQFRAGLNAAPGTAYRVDFYTVNACDPSGYGEGQRHMKSVSVTTNIDGVGLAVADFPSTYFSTLNFITATATDPNGNTSEFSNCIQVVDATPTPNAKLELTPTPTLTLPMKGTPFFTAKVTPKLVYYRGAGCGEKQALFQVQVAEPAKVAGVWLFVRLRNKAGDGVTAWSEALVMLAAGSGGYSYTLISEEITDFTKYDEAWIQYQFVAYDKDFTRVATSEVFADLELAVCHR